MNTQEKAVVDAAIKYVRAHQRDAVKIREEIRSFSQRRALDPKAHPDSTVGEESGAALEVLTAVVDQLEHLN